MHIVLERLIILFMRGMNKLTPTCEVISQQISESLDHKILLSSRLRIRLHLLFCKFCRRYQQQLMTMHTMFDTYIQKAEEITPVKEPGLSAEAREKIKQNLRKS